MEFKKYVGVGEYIFVLRKDNKYIKFYETYRDYHTKKKIYPDYDEYIKQLLIYQFKNL